MASKSLHHFLPEEVDHQAEDLPPPSDADIQKANDLEEEANQCVKAQHFNEAVEKFSQAIKLNRDPVFLCNRAAAYCRLEQYDLAIKDCRSALVLDKKCAKAYGCMGLALTHQSHYDAALEAHGKALELDPFYMVHHKLNEALDAEKISAASNICSQMFGEENRISEFSDLMNNPHMMNAAIEMMDDPVKQKFMTNMLQQFMGGLNEEEGGATFEDLLTTGEGFIQNITDQIKEAFPEIAPSTESEESSTGEEDISTESSNE